MPHSRPPLRRLSLAGTLALALPLLGGCAATQAPLPAALSVARQQAAIPFTAATANRIAGSDDYRLDWAADHAGTVRVYAGTSPDGVTTGTPVALGPASGSAVVTGLEPGRRWYFTLVPDNGAPLVIADRALHLPTAPNLRDIGGYRTTDGRWVKMGLIYRSDQLDRLSDADLAAMGALGLSAVADLRTATERARGADRLPRGAAPLVLDVVADSEGSLGGDMRKADAAIAAGKGVEMLIEANREFVSLPSARSAYAALLRRLEQAPPTATLYHCTAGKDRTGWATAVILTLLGVPRETVMADYLLSNAYLRAKNEATQAALAKAGTPIPPAYLEQVLTVRPDYLQSAFDEVERRHGSFDAYLRDGLGLTEADIAALRRLYLAGEAVD
ncbi:protein-tyrosine-phosphatase [Sphingobium jiangsuense]|uniref:Protein-tyrosine phosphatase n=1 Tax=Sphingobium jiangsuense TaxID=870476 RepID=A0A7W6BL41_9SPHN|nr:tyrosine-protein phosphatase [Sphingobium jiangsuense]MBB3926946.1 protein-tyrosine phosphatase [Sphingobium jiangsuense]GLT02304.1 protein-tyrosine-phosphatase [Sphingobium jiangsuense]